MNPTRMYYKDDYYMMFIFSPEIYSMGLVVSVSTFHWPSVLSWLKLLHAWDLGVVGSCRVSPVSC